MCQREHREKDAHREFGMCLVCNSCVWLHAFVCVCAHIQIRVYVDVCVCTAHREFGVHLVCMCLCVWCLCKGVVVHVFI